MAQNDNFIKKYKINIDSVYLSSDNDNIDKKNADYERTAILYDKKKDSIETKDYFHPKYLIDFSQDENAILVHHQTSR